MDMKPEYGINVHAGRVCAGLLTAGTMRGLRKPMFMVGELSFVPAVHDT